MIVDGTWDTQKFTDSMGTNVAAFVPPFSNSRSRVSSSTPVTASRS